MLLVIIPFCCALFIVVYVYISTNKIYHHWQKKGVPHVKPVYFFGNLKDVVLRKKNFRETLDDLYNSYKDARYIGCYQFFTPNLLIKDPDLIKELTIKAFDSFSDHTLWASKKRDSVWANTIIVKSAEDGWSESRAKISPTFTGRKLRIMIPLMQECIRNLVKFLKQSNETVRLEMKDTFSKLASDIVTSAAFGVTVNSIDNEHNAVYSIGKKAGDFSGYRSLVFTGYTNFPKLMDLFQIRMFDKNIIKFFKKLIKEAINTRKESNIFRPDFIHLLTKEQEGTNNGFQMSNDEIIGHCITIFLGGAETLSSVLTVASYELAINPDIQNKIYDEIARTFSDCNGTLSYDLISQMKYLDAVISEILRLHAPAFLIDRKCVKPYVIEPKKPGELPITIDKGTCIWVPILQVHRDPNNFSNPHKFDPERFYSETGKNDSPNAYIPFGLGPRFCVGTRYALLVIKVVLIEILKGYEFVRLHDTQVPINFQIDSFFMVPKGGLWIGLKQRSQIPSKE